MPDLQPAKNRDHLHLQRSPMYRAENPSRLRILLAIPSMVPGGSERVMLNLLRFLDSERFEPHLAVLQRCGVWLRNIPTQVEVHELGVSRARRAVVAFATLCHRIRPQA